MLAPMHISGSGDQTVLGVIISDTALKALQDWIIYLIYYYDDS
ncbi:hypothetical protein NT01EI_1919 [Edwardsiella ictaluri 93-146]|uniref:Uncharacterized protein n=1 Tax=Edwardsiella ictaluri (strain 93-146) TaxID=634503 RepID=C5B878_EDWI9|nr:hypothetical protein NT01EI_1919 [Edwardsiella ictaluri 93-146]